MSVSARTGVRVSAVGRGHRKGRRKGGAARGYRVGEGLRRTRRLTEVFAWITALGALGAVLGSSAGPARFAVVALILVVLVWWASRRRIGSWWLTAVEALAITSGCLILSSPEPMLGFLFGATTRRAVRNELGPCLLRAAPPFAGYLSGALWGLLVRNSGDFDPSRLAPSLMPLVGLVVGTLALGDTVSAVGTARAANERLDAILRTSPVALVVLDTDHHVRLCNDRARGMFGWSVADRQQVPCTHHPSVADCPHGCLEMLRERGTDEWIYPGPHGTPRTVVVHIADVPDGAVPVGARDGGARDGEPAGSSGFLLAFVDISARKDLEDRLRVQVERDHLTGVASRTHFTELVQSSLDDRSLVRRAALLLIDLDDFKEVNDAYGHPAGDDVLIAAAKQVQHAVASAGVVGRLGGDEFAVLADGCDEGAAARLAERILAALAHTPPVAGRDVEMRASIGIAVATERTGIADGADGTEESAAVMLRDADTAMYVAKHAGGNRAQLFHPRMRTALLDRQRDEADLRQALAEEQFELFFQPIVDLRTGGVVSVEALIRWRHPDRGLLPPAPVVKLAEETGLIVPLGNWALRVACGQAVRWAEDGLVIGMSVNVSARQLHTAEFVDTVAGTLAESGLPPNRLTLELTESALIRPSALQVLGQIRAQGVRVALDDFGTGYSSLSYLQRHPFDLIKIDRSFTGQLGRTPTAEGIVQCILQLAEVLDTPVVGEGVETRAHAEFLAASGCAFAQGYFYGKPVPATEWAGVGAPTPQSAP